MPESQSTPGTDHEGIAKAAILNFAYETGFFGTEFVAVSELELRSAGRRADLVFASTDLFAIEIKTAADNISRLHGQLSVYCNSFPLVYVALATRHISRSRQSIPKSCGILEIRTTSAGTSVHVRRGAKRIGTRDPDIQLSLAPSSALKRLVRDASNINTSNLRRLDLVELAKQIPIQKRDDFLLTYLREKYSKSSNALETASMGRRISLEDLSHLRAWPRSARENYVDTDTRFYTWLLKTHGPEPLGKIPRDIIIRSAAQY